MILCYITMIIIINNLIMSVYIYIYVQVLYTNIAHMYIFLAYYLLVVLIQQIQINTIAML